MPNAALPASIEALPRTNAPFYACLALMLGSIGLGFWGTSAVEATTASLAAMWVSIGLFVLSAAGLGYRMLVSHPTDPAPRSIRAAGSD